MPCPFPKPGNHWPTHPAGDLHRKNRGFKVCLPVGEWTQNVAIPPISSILFLSIYSTFVHILLFANQHP